MRKPKIKIPLLLPLQKAPIFANPPFVALYYVLFLLFCAFPFLSTTSTINISSSLSSSSSLPQHDSPPNPRSFLQICYWTNRANHPQTNKFLLIYGEFDRIIIRKVHEKLASNKKEFFSFRIRHEPVRRG